MVTGQTPNLLSIEFDSLRVCHWGCVAGYGFPLQGKPAGSTPDSSTHTRVAETADAAGSDPVFIEGSTPSASTHALAFGRRAVSYSAQLGSIPWRGSRAFVG